MKLLFCTECRDVLALRRERRTCACGRSAGRYVDRLNAEISGPSLALAFLNQEFFGVLDEQLILGDLDEKLAFPPYTGETKGREFTGIVIPETAPTVRRLDAGPYPPRITAEALADGKLQGLSSLRDEMKAVARGDRPAPDDVAEPSTTLREFLIVGELPDDIVAAIKAAEYGKVLDLLKRHMTTHPENVRPFDPVRMEALQSQVAGTEADPEAHIEPDEDSEAKD